MLETGPGESSPSARISFNMHPRWSSIDQLPEFLNAFKAAGLTTLEFELDQHLPDWSSVPGLMSACYDLGFELCFHAPYRHPNGISGFTSEKRSEILSNYTPMLKLAQDWANRSHKDLNIVVHGAKSSTRGYELIKEDTSRFLEWCLGEFPGLNFAFEVAGPSENGEIKIGGDRNGVWEMVRSFDHPRLGICWDMGHDYLNGSIDLPESEWLEKVIHVHVHDVDDQGVDHYPMVFGKVPYRRWLPALRNCEMKGIITLEIKGGLLRSWKMEQIYAALIDSFSTIRRLMA